MNQPAGKTASGTACMRFKLGSAWFCDTECMDSVEDLVTELKALTPDQLTPRRQPAAAGDRSSLRPGAGYLRISTGPHSLLHEVRPVL